MRILVIEDKVMHQESARQTLVGHELTIVSSFDEAMNLMLEKIDEQNVQRLLSEAGFPSQPVSPRESKAEGARERWDAYWATMKMAEAQSIIPFPFDVVLTDMMMPMSASTLAPGVFNSDEQVPYGFIIALRAALLGVKFVAMVTDTNHHKGAMSAAIDHLGSAYYHEGFKPNFVVNGAKVMFVHTPFIADPTILVSCNSCVGGMACGYCRTSLVEGKCPKCERAGRTLEQCYACKGVGKTTVADRKDWGQVLKDLIA